MLAEFEEKQYEQHLNIELLQGSNLIFPPGQHLENILGFDAALFTRNKAFWRHFLGGYPWYRRFFKNYLNGLYFPKDAFELKEAFDNDLPKFKFNAFIQHKRPERMVKDNALEWQSWGREYYRYKVLEHQQKILESLESSVGNEGVVTYARPAFHTKEEFWNVHKNQSFIQSSNFCQPHKLIGHNSYSYLAAGTAGIAHSEPEEVESKNLLEELQRLSQSESQKEISNSEFVAKSCDLVESSLKTQEKIMSLYSDIVRDLDESHPEAPKLFRDLYRLSVFKFVSGTNLYFGVQEGSFNKQSQRTRPRLLR